MAESRKPDRAALRREQAAQQRAARARAERNGRLLRYGGGGAGVVILVVVVLVLVLTRSTGTSTKPRPDASSGTGSTGAGLGNGAAGPEGIALQTGTPLASLDRAATGGTVDGVQCDASEQAAQHIHAHLAVYVDGRLRPVAPGVGVVKPVAQGSGDAAFYGASQCYYWLHVHAQDGVIHVEAPNQSTFTLGQFFAVYGQPLSTTDVGGVTGTQTVYVDGKPYTGDPAQIPLTSHGVIQIDVGTVVPPQPVNWAANPQL